MFGHGAGYPCAVIGFAVDFKKTIVTPFRAVKNKFDF